jgi:hypothetical protein
MIETEHISDAADILIIKYHSIADELKKIQYKDVVFCIIPIVENDRQPCIDIEGELKNLIFSLNADISIDYYYVKGDVQEI